MWAMRAFSVRLNFLFILAVPCQISDQLAATKHGELRSAITSRSKESYPQITRITVDTKNRAGQHNNPTRRQLSSLNAAADGWDDSAADARSSADAASLSRIWYLLHRRRHPDNVRLPSRRSPTILVASRHHPGRRRPVQQSSNSINRTYPVQRSVNSINRTNPVQQSINSINSGVHLRLKGNSSLNEGLVEVLVNNRWGYICNDDQWDTEDAKVVCKQLGFISTADTSLRTSSRISPNEPFVMSNVVCNGSERKIQDCVYRESTACANRRPARVYCALNSGCQAGWVSGNGFCYKLVKSATTFEESEARCRSLDAYLVKIETQMENNFLSNMLMAERAEGAIWTSGRRSERIGQPEWRWLGASHALRFTKWFPGWNIAGLHRQPNAAANHSCIALSKAFLGSGETIQEVDYYFWMSLPCTRNLQFVCKKAVQNSDCFEGNGTEYRGTAFVTTRASLCQRWTVSNRINPVTHPHAGLGDHNHCRNPDGDERPWCWVDADQGRFGYCALSSCPTEASMATPPNIETPMNKVRLRDGRHEYEGRVEVWHDGEWGSVCNNQWGIPDAEVVCRQLGFVGAVRTSSMLEFSSRDGVNMILDEVQCTGLENSLYECTHSPWGDHNCRSYETAGVVCKPNKVCVQEKEIACPARNGQGCVPLQYVCDRESDCRDNSDEANCSYMEVALVGGSRPSEGRVEITINNITGTVCDDDWDDRDAAVICRMIGYSTGIAQAVTGAQFGRGKGPIWLDNVDCEGDEDDIQDCEHPIWGDHNCMHNEDAGVSCLTSGRTFPPRITYSPVAADCGRRPIRQAQAKIVGGQYAMYGAYPWQARILKRNLMNEFVHSCGGTVIGQHWILSAAHCFEHTLISDLRIRVGDHRSNAYDHLEQDFAVERLFLHPSYSNILSFLFGSARYDNDIALVKLRSTGSRSGILFSNHVQPVCLPSSSAEYSPGLICEVSGWGLSGQSTPSILMSAVVPIKPFSECQSLYKHKLSRKMFCAGYRDGRADTCQGDSGGPLVCNVNGVYKIMGITSWGLGCGIRDSPGVYTKVGEFSDWIQQTIRVHSEH